MRWELGLKAEAKKLRANGYTYSEIGQKLNRKIPKETLSGWCKGIKLPGFYQEKLRKINKINREKGRKIALIVNKEKRRKFLSQLKEKNGGLVKELDLRDKKLLLAAFYLAEGAKYLSTGYLKFSNSNPRIIQLFLYLLRGVFKLDESKFRVGILCRADQNLNYLRKFWHEVTGIDYKQIYKPRVDKRTIGKKTKKKNYWGVGVVDYFDTGIQLEIELLGESLLENFCGPVVYR